MRLIITSWNSAWQPEEDESGQLDHNHLSTVMLCRGLEKSGMIGAKHGHGMTSVNQTRPHCVNQMGKTHSKLLAARHGTGMTWARHSMCESALNVPFPSNSKNIFTNYLMVLYANRGLLHRHYCNSKVDQITCPISDKYLLTHPSIRLDNLPFDWTYEGHLESKERFAIKKYLLIIGKKTNMQVLSHTFTCFST